MANIIQKIIYNLSAVSPLCFVFAFAWYIQEKSIWIPLIAVGIGSTLVILFSISFSYAKKHLAHIQIRTSNIRPCDKWVVIYFISYFFPFASVILKDFNVWICAVTGAVIVLIISFMNSAIPNPLLLIRLYHFYQIDAENGISDYVLISKRKFRSKKELNVVNRVFDFLLLDGEGR